MKSKSNKRKEPLAAHGVNIALNVQGKSSRGAKNSTASTKNGIGHGKNGHAKNGHAKNGHAKNGKAPSLKLHNPEVLVLQPITEPVLTEAQLYNLLIKVRNGDFSVRLPAG